MISLSDKRELVRLPRWHGNRNKTKENRGEEGVTRDSEIALRQTRRRRGPIGIFVPPNHRAAGNRTKRAYFFFSLYPPSFQFFILPSRAPRWFMGTDGADGLPLSLLLLYVQTIYRRPFIRGSALIEWTERKVMTRPWRLLVTWNKVVKTVSRGGSIDLPELRLRLSVSGCTFGRTCVGAPRRAVQRLATERNEDETRKRRIVVIFQAAPLTNFSCRGGRGPEGWNYSYNVIIIQRHNYHKASLKLFVGHHQRKLPLDESQHIPRLLVIEI